MKDNNKKNSKLLILLASFFILLIFINNYFENRRNKDIINNMRHIEVPKGCIIDIQYLPLQHSETEFTIEYNGSKMKLYGSRMYGTINDFLKIGDTIYANKDELIYHVKRDSVIYFFPKYWGDSIQSY